MRTFITVSLFIIIIVSYIEQRLHIRMLQNEAKESNKHVLAALSVANECKTYLRSNMKASRINEAKLKEMVRGLGLVPEDRFLSMGGEQ